MNAEDKEVKMSVVTTAARRMARTVNAAVSRNSVSGFLLFRRDGSGGAWYSDNARPDMAGSIAIRLTARRVTAAQMQDRLDCADE